MLIPDEFQLDDELWRAVEQAAGVELQRDRAQDLIKAGLVERDIACLDLLPVLRAAPALDDGKRHLYHLRDTHFNARGNRVVGEALATFLEALLASED